MKLIAILITFGVCALAGLRLSQRLEGRAALLSSLREELSGLLGAVQISRKPFAVLIEERQSLRHGMLFAQYTELRKALAADAALRALWQGAAVDYAALTDEERGAVAGLLAAFTTCDCITLARRGEEALSLLDARAKEAGAEFAAKGRIYRSVGLLLGAAIAIVML